jgi:hypothetical protein
MFRHVICCLPLLVLSATVGADDIASTAAPSQDAQKHEARAEARAKKEEPKADASAKKAQAKSEEDVKMSGMSILGNDEAPKSLVIVPWKSSQLGDTPAISRLLDDSTQPVDTEVFLRELAYYQIRSNSK